MRFFFFTKTDWTEPPRLRHQMARLLANAGHEVIFFQRPYHLWQRFGKDSSGEQHIKLFRYRQLLHHKLRINTVLHRFNALFEKNQILSLMLEHCIDRNDVIINFNYDYFYLKDIFRKNRLITIINDDFWSNALGGYKRPLKWALKKTLQSSDVVLTVSLTLKNELSKFSSVELFYPWSNIRYKSPDLVSTKSTILFWGYINYRININFISNLAKCLVDFSSNFKILFVGPNQDRSLISKITCHENVRVYPSADLENIDLSDVFLGLIPYRSGVRDVDVITFPNKVLPLLSRGLPIAITGMPNFLSAPFVFRLDQGRDSDIATLQFINKNFAQLQTSIRAFVDANDSDMRLKQFFSYL